MRQSHIDVVTGNKVFARDLRAPDIKNIDVYENEDWGSTTLRALLLRASLFGRKITGIKKDILEKRGVTKCLVKYPSDQQGWSKLHDVIANKEAATLKDKYDDYLVSIGYAAKYVGQPICVLLFSDAAHFLDAQREKNAISAAIQYGSDGDEFVESFESGEFLDEAAPMFEERKWPPQKKWNKFLHPGAVSNEKDYKPEVSVFLDEQASRVLSFVTKSGAVDTGHLEPDSALGRILKSKDTDKDVVQLIVPTQGHSQDIKSLTKRNEIFGFDFEFLPCRLGGGFGGRSASPFHYYAALAAIAGEGLPVRLEYDRLEQFAAGIKRHPSWIETRILVDGKGEIDAFEANVLMDGGSVRNLSSSVAKLSRHSTLGAYRTNSQTGRSAALKNSGVLSGSMRGFGIPQALFNTEQQVDRIAASLGEDPIAYRRRIAIKTGDPDIDGKPHMHPIKNDEVLGAASEHTHWKDRAARKRAFDEAHGKSGKFLGTGMAFAMEAYGTSTDRPAVGLSINDKLQIEVDIFPVRMGQGTVDGLEDVVNASFGTAPLVFNTGQGAKLSRFLETTVDTNAAAKGTYGSMHVFRQILDVWLTYVWGPMILEALGESQTEAEASKISFGKNGYIHYDGLGSIPYDRIATQVLQSNEAQIFGLGKFKNTWAYGEFDFSADGNANDPRWLAKVTFSDRCGNTRHVGVENIIDPTKRKTNDTPAHFEEKHRPYRSLFASAACMVDVVVDNYGMVRLEEVTLVLDAGTRLSDSRIKGQVEGGIAQGIGHTLFESYPAGPVGGQQQINFDRYTMPRIRHMPANGINTVFVDVKPGEALLNPIESTTLHKPKIDLPHELHKGIAEISISPIAPAIANAIIDAIFTDKKKAHDQRFVVWPIEGQHIRQRIRAGK